ncbi:PTS sugar transporter subunit IIA [uncultured Fusobacterium sp.]|uniref:PTS sugar transporter subunit IIA n=1 Tax=uncultured Fusobacterium sp. TaxID=159267 RepID=UPI0025EED445|nr:PTS sugar transporter subunit IIA [uncultured Fusobacterium sp.]
MLQDYLNSKLITYITGKHTKEEVLKTLVDLIRKNSDYLKDEKHFYENIVAREELGSTGIGQGIAIPHARSEKIEKFVVAIGLLENKINFNSPDGEDVKLIILVGAPKGQNREYLSLVSQLMRTFRDKNFRENILCAHNYQELLEAIAELK